MWEILQGASTADQATIPEGTEQIFVMPQNVSDAQKEDLAWATYILLRNTNTIAAVYHCIIIYHLWNQSIKRGPCKKVGGGTWVYDYQVLMRHQLFFFSDKDLLIIDVLGIVKLTVFLSIYCLTFSVNSGWRSIMCTWLLEHTREGLKRKLTWLVRETNWKDWPEKFEGQHLFSSAWRYP